MTLMLINISIRCVASFVSIKGVLRKDGTRAFLINYQVKYLVKRIFDNFDI